MLSERAGVIAMGETRIEILVSDHIVVLFSACLPAFQPNLGKALFDFDFLECLFVDPMAKAMTPNSLSSSRFPPYIMGKSHSSRG